MKKLFPQPDVRVGLLTYLTNDALSKLKTKKQILRADSPLKEETEDVIRKFTELRKKIPAGQVSMETWHDVFRECHALYALLGGVLTGDHWQSPAHMASIIDEVGDEQGKITANFNDYKRDQHPVGLRWERAFAREYLTRSFTTVPTAFATSSGMAALTLTITFVAKHIPRTARIAVGMHSYFQNKELLTALFAPEQIVFFNESKPDGSIPADVHAIFFDTLANDPTMTVADTAKIFSIAKGLTHRVYVVADVTCTSSVKFRLPMLGIGKNVSLLVWESLVKFHQFGLDRTHGGVVWAVNVSEFDLYYLRAHSGTIVSEWSAAVLPSPNARLFATYIERLERNAYAVAAELHSKLAADRFSVYYPGLSEHDGYAAAKKQGYAGAFVCITPLKKQLKNIQAPVKKIVKEAAVKRIALVGGSSFGLPVTRVYAVATNTKFVKPFLRIAPGLESPEELSSIIDVCVRVLMTP